MKYWLIPDTHFGHANMCRLRNRPGNFEDIICDRWQQRVSEKDIVIHLGDVAIKGTSWVKRLTELRGRKILVRGNHDRKSAQEYIDLGFDFVCDSFELKLGKIKMLFSHEAVQGHLCDINIPGHQHDMGRSYSDRLYLPLAIELMDYKPLELSEKVLEVFHGWVLNFRQSGELPPLSALLDLMPAPRKTAEMLDSEGRMIKADPAV